MNTPKQMGPLFHLVTCVPVIVITNDGLCIRGWALKMPMKFPSSIKLFDGNKRYNTENQGQNIKV